MIDFSEGSPSYVAPVKIGIVVKLGPNPKHLKYLGRLLASVWHSDAAELKDGTIEVLALGWNCGVDIMSDIFNGRQLGVNQLAKIMAPDGVIAMVDNDIELPADWYSKVKALFDGYPDMGAIFPKVDGSYDFTVPRINVAGYLGPAGIRDHIEGKRTDMCVFFRPAMVKDVFHYSHDWFFWQLGKGWHTLVTPNIVVSHKKEPEWE